MVMPRRVIVPSLLSFGWHWCPLLLLPPTSVPVTVTDVTLVTVTHGIRGVEGTREVIQNLTSTPRWHEEQPGHLQKGQEDVPVAGPGLQC